MLPDTVAQAFSAGPGYLNTASVGLPPRRSIAALQRSIDEWEAGKSEPASFDAIVDRSRRAFAGVVGVSVGAVGIVGQVSVVSGLVASCLPDGAVVLVAEEDFTSVLFPFLADDRLDVRIVPLEHLVTSIDPGVDLVAVSAVQSADGRVTNLDALADAATEVGARTYVDLTQGAGWLPIDAARLDVTACGAYKWLCAGRGSGFITVSGDSSWLVPRHAGWYSGDDVWRSIYGPPLRLAGDARRFNVSPAWLDFVTAAESLELLSDVGVDRIHEHNVSLANALLERLSLPASDSAIVSIDTPHGAALQAAGITAAVRAGKVRLSFHLYNTIADVEAAAGILAA